MIVCSCSITPAASFLVPTTHQWNSVSHARGQVSPMFVARNNLKKLRVLPEQIEVEVGERETITWDAEADAEVLGVNGVSVQGEEVERAKPPSRVWTRDGKQAVEDDNSYDRYKLWNGREVFEEKAFLVGVEVKGDGGLFGIEESLKELSQLVDTAGLKVVGSTYQKLANPNPRTYIGSGKVAEIKSAVHALDVETVIFDDELSAGQLRNLEKAFGGDVRVCDRTALILLDIFNQRAATHEASLQWQPLEQH